MLLYMVFDSDMHIFDLLVEKLLKTYSNHDVLQNSILHLWDTSPS